MFASIRFFSTSVFRVSSGNSHLLLGPASARFPSRRRGTSRVAQSTTLRSASTLICEPLPLDMSPSALGMICRPPFRNIHHCALSPVAFRVRLSTKLHAHFSLSTLWRCRFFFDVPHRLDMAPGKPCPRARPASQMGYSPRLHDVGA